MITNTPFVAISSGDKLPQQVILNSASGKIICNSRDAGITSVVSVIFYETGNILIYGVTPAFQPVVALFDISTGTIKWQKSNLFGKGLFAEKWGAPWKTVGCFHHATGAVFTVSTATVMWSETPLPKVAAQPASETEVQLLKSLRR